MSLTLDEIKAISEMAKLLYSFLPGNPHPFADQSISFKGIAYELELGKFWQGGSKLPAITTLLERTLKYKRDKFCALILEIVKRGIKYRANKGDEITREEIETLNELLLKIKFKIPELWDNSFLMSLPSKIIEKQTKKEVDSKILKDFKQRLLKLNNLNPQERGYQFEKLLQEIFELFDLAPRSSFKLIGEQIDGSIELDNHTYLVEAKWQNKRVDEKELLAFHGKIEGKAKWSKGLFISYSGFTDEALNAFVKGKTINLIVMDGLDLFEVLDSKIRLDKLIKLKSRYAAETGDIMARADDLIHLYLKS